VVFGIGFAFARVCFGDSISNNQAIHSGFESPYAELALVLRSNTQAIDSMVAQHAIQVRNTFLEQSKFPLNLCGNINYTHENGKRYHSNDAIAWVGLDFSYNNFILKRICTAGVFGGVSKDYMRYRCDELSKGNMRTGFGGYYGNFTILGLDISTLSLLGSGKSNTNCPTFSFSETNFSHFTHSHRIIHSKIDVGHTWELGNLDFTPTIGLCADQLKQNGATEWQQNSLRLKVIDGIGGVRIGRDYEKFCTNLFLGAEHNLHKRWSGGEIKVNDVSENFTLTAFDKTKFLVSMGLCYDCIELWDLDLSFSGRYGSRHRNSTFGLTLSKNF
jgi:hypothetical protein